MDRAPDNATDDEVLDLLDARDATYANRRRIKGDRGKALLSRRGEYLERSFAHAYETGAMRRLHLRHRDNIAKRVLIHVAGFNLGLLMRLKYGLVKPRRLQKAVIFALARLTGAWHRLRAAMRPIKDQLQAIESGICPPPIVAAARAA